jgi:hypothetical protein
LQIRRLGAGIGADLDGTISRHMGGRDLASYFAAEYARFRAILTELSLAKSGT